MLHCWSLVHEDIKFYRKINEHKKFASYKPNNQRERERESKKFTNLKIIKYKKMSKAHFTLHNSFLIS